MNKSAAYRLGEKAAEGKLRGYYNQAKNYVKDITGDVRGLAGDVKDVFNRVTTPSASDVKLRKGRAQFMKDTFGDTDITSGGHLRGAGYAERIPGLKLKNIDDTVTAGGYGQLGSLGLKKNVGNWLSRFKR